MDKTMTIVGGNDFYSIASRIEDVIDWAKEKGILDYATAARQAEKTVEEAQELESAVLVEDKEEIKDGIGDTLVTLIIQAEMQGLTLLECLEHAYNQIKDRQGEMINGTFVKEGD